MVSMKETEPLSIARSFYALGANVVRAEMLEAIQNYPPCKHMSPKQIVDLLDAFNNEQLQTMARLVMSNAATDNRKKLRKAHARACLGKNPKTAQAEITSGEIKAGLLERGERYLKKGKDNPRLTAHQLRLGVTL